jgi:hypothetical protein
MPCMGKLALQKRKRGSGAEERIRTADLEVNSFGLATPRSVQAPALTRLSHLGT